MERIDIRRINKIIEILAKQYPEAKTSLIHSNPFQLLIATILSAQTTDKQVNKILPSLFEKFKTPENFAGSSLKEIEDLVSSVNFYKNKAKYIYQLSKRLVEKYNNKVPDSMEELIKLPGVARKTANVVLSQSFDKNEGIVVDTHVKRVTARLGFTQNTDPVRIEKDLMKIIPQKEWGSFSYRIILHGRNICTAKRPKCEICIVEKFCPSSLLKK